MKRLIIIMFVLLAVFAVHGDAIADLNNGLVAYYPLDGNANDSTEYGNNGTEQGGVDYVQGIKGQGASFDGIDDKVLVSSNSQINFGAGPFTISFWAKTSSNDYSIMIDKDYSNVSSGLYRFRLTGEGKGAVSIQDSDHCCSEDIAYTATAINDGQWHHLVGVRSSSSLLIYVDGEFSGIDNDLFIGNTDNSKPLAFGGASISGAMYEGTLDEISIYNRALSDAEIDGLYAAGSNGSTTDHDTVSITSATLNSSSLTANTSATLNSSSLTANAAQLSVTEGETVSGTVNITVHNTHSSSAIFPVGWCTSWASDNATGYTTIDSWADTGDSNYTVNINTTAPTLAGTYYLTFAAGADYSTANTFASKCGSAPPSSSDWNNGNDIADLGSSAYSTSNSQHWVSINGDGGCTREPGVAMIKVVVKTSSNPPDSSKGFNYQGYLAANPDLPKTWGKSECINHYVQYGFQENRAVSFQFELYLEANPDLPDTWGRNEALNHYNLYGKYEGRLLAFSAGEYLSLYSDLPTGWNQEQALNHYLAFGQYEGRIASFDETAYLEIYPDLPSSWGQAEAFYHYLYFGQYERRVYDSYDETAFDDSTINDDSGYPDTVVETISIDGCPYYTAVSPDNSFIYVTNVCGDLTVIQTSTNNVVATIPVTGDYDYNGVAVTPDGKYLYAPNRELNTVSVVQTSTHSVVASIPVSGSPRMVAVTPNGSYVYVTQPGINTVSVIQTSNNAVIDTLTVGSYPKHLDVSPDGNYVYFSDNISRNESGDIFMVSVLQTATNSIVAEIQVGGYPLGMAVSSDGNHVYVANDIDGTVSVIQTCSNTVIDTITVGDQTASDVAVTPDGNYLYVVDGVDKVYVIQTTTNSVIDSITVGSDPANVAISPDGNSVYVTSDTDRTITVIQ